MTPPKTLNRVLFDAKQQTIFGVIGRMEVLLTLFSQQKARRSFVPFLETYCMVTKEVAKRGLHTGYFKDVKAIQNLDVTFAQLYFSPLERFLRTGLVSAPWKTYFEYCSRRTRIPFLEMLLGINAHINGDLPIALAQSNYKQRQDFLTINTILKDLIPDIMSFLALHDGDLLGTGAIVFEEFVTTEFKKIIVRWRTDAWENAARLRKNPNIRKQIHARTEIVAQQLIKLFHDVYNMKNPSTTLYNLEHLSSLIS